MDSSTSLSISLSLASQTSTSSANRLSKSITIPATLHNRRLIEYCDHPNSAEMFNHTPHKARVEVCGCVVLDGTLRLTASAVGKGGYYRFNIVGEGCKWRKCADIAISSMMEEWSMLFAPESVRDSWTSEEAIVRFLPVERGTGSGKEEYVGRILPENYHPFIHIATLLREMFAKAGYAVESDFIASEFFNSLYMSGKWSERVSGSWKQTMDFRALREEDSPTIKADYGGRVYASPLRNYNTIGNLVGIPTDTPNDSNSEGCLEIEESTGRICFTPKRAVMVAFDYLLRWRTQYRIKSRTELTGLSQVRFCVGDSIKIPLHNTFVALSAEQIIEGGEYAFIVFEKEEGVVYHLVADEIINPEANPDSLQEGDFQKRVLLSTTSRLTHFAPKHKGRLCNLRVEIECDGEVVSLVSDWAVYDGFVQEYGTMELEVRLRSKPVNATPTNPVYFDTFYLGGGEEGMEVTVLSGCSIQPVFYPHPQLGDTLGWEDVADISATGMDLIVALQELFDLQILTDSTTRTVYVEPRKEFYDNRRVVDLSESIDLSQPVVIEELGFGHPQTLRLAYRTGDMAVDEYGKECGIRYGEWRAKLLNIFATDGEQSLVNDLFTASLSKRGTVLEAPSAHLIVAQTNAGDGCVMNLNFPTKLVSFRGMVSLPKGERWSCPNDADTEYPLLTFFDDGSIAGTPCSLLFEDRDGVEGLHRWWDGYVASLNHSRRVTLHIHFAPEQIETLANNFVGIANGFRVLYRLRIEGESVLCRLEEICDYNPTVPSTKAVFVTI